MLCKERREVLSNSSLKLGRRGRSNESADEQWECYTGRCNGVRTNESTELEKPQVVQLQYIVPTTKVLLGFNTF